MSNPASQSYVTYGELFVMVVAQRDRTRQAERELAALKKEYDEEVKSHDIAEKELKSKAESAWTEGYNYRGTFEQEQRNRANKAEGVELELRARLAEVELELQSCTRVINILATKCVNAAS